MPRFRHHPRSKPTRERRIRVLVDDGVVVGTAHPILADLPEAERAVLVSEAIDLCYAERHARRLPILRERLREWPVDMWGDLFCQAPELLGELTPSQRLAWDAWQEGTAPVQQHVNDVRAKNDSKNMDHDKQLASHTSEIANLDMDLSQTKERLRDTDATANQAGDAAKVADQKAGAAKQAADGAR